MCRPPKRLFLSAAIVYVISPLDLIPDVFPFIGQVDDIYVVALTLLRLVNRTDEVGRPRALVGRRRHRRSGRFDREYRPEVPAETRRARAHVTGRAGPGGQDPPRHHEQGRSRSFARSADDEDHEIDARSAMAN